MWRPAAMPLRVLFAERHAISGCSRHAAGPDLGHATLKAVASPPQKKVHIVGNHRNICGLRAYNTIEAGAVRARREDECWRCRWQPGGRLPLAAGPSDRDPIVTTAPALPNPTPVLPRSKSEKSAGFPRPIVPQLCRNRSATRHKSRQSTFESCPTVQNGAELYRTVHPLSRLNRMCRHQL